MTSPADHLAQNIHEGAGGHGLSLAALQAFFNTSPDPVQLAYTLRRCSALAGSEAFTTDPNPTARPQLIFTPWHHIDSTWDASWGFDRRDPGCYVYGLWPQGAPLGPADYVNTAVIYIGESRAVTRNCMLGRRTDFRGTVRNPRLSPYGCGTEFKRHFGQASIDHVYQAYLPMSAHWCRQVELELLRAYYLQQGRVPLCNPPRDLARVLRLLEMAESAVADQP